MYMSMLHLRSLRRKELFAYSKVTFTEKLYSKDVSKSLNLPATKFPLSMKDGISFKREQIIQEVINLM